MYGKSWILILHSSHRHLTSLYLYTCIGEVDAALLRDVVPGVVRMNASCHENYHIES
jgi:hypothetical protein